MPAPTHRIQIQKHIGAEVWDNDYLVSAADMSVAAGYAALLLDFERALHRPEVTFDFTLVSTVTVGDRVFVHTPVNLPGLNPNVGPDILLPLFNTLRLDLQTADSDPGRKYYRGVLLAGDLQSDFTLAPSRLANYQTIVAGNAGRPSQTGVVTPKGNDIVGQTVADTIQGRQLHRKRRKKVTT